MILPEHPITLLEVGDIGAYFHNFTSNIGSENSRPLLDEEAVVLDLPVHGVDCDAVVLDDDFVGTWGWVFALGHLAASSVRVFERPLHVSKW
jgi:hypothetical protein